MTGTSGPRPVPADSRTAGGGGRTDRGAASWMPWQVPAEQVLVVLGSSAEGLDDVEATARRAPLGVAQRRPPTWLRELAESVTEPLQLLLLAVGVLSAVFGEVRDAIAIFAVIAAVVVVETLSELRAERALDALRDLSAPTVRVLRGGEVTQHTVRDVVVGDVVVVEAGDRVGADARVLHGSGLRVDESTLTGEPTAVGKSADAVNADAVLAERSSMLYAGTSVVAGEGRAVVLSVGPDTELGHLGRLVATEREPATPLQLALRELARVVLVVAVAASVAVPLVGVLAGRGVREMILAGLSLAFATVPEELPILVTVLLAVGGRQLAARGALVRRLRAAETIGAVTAVVTDKTGTLTENRMRLVEVVGDRARVLAVAAATLPPTGAASREPMDAEIAAAAGAHGLALGVEAQPVGGEPFDPARKLVSRAWRSPDRHWLAVGGAPEAVLTRCVMSETDRAAVLGRADALADRGLRVIAYADRELPTSTDLMLANAAGGDQVGPETGLAFVGLVAFDDPLRAGVVEAVAALDEAGVATIMLTGDHPRTATALARRAGMPVDVVLTGGDLQRLDDDQLGAQLGHGSVLARATPADKLRVVRVLQACRQIVAVTGDGANDAPALAAADVGIAMGQRGSDLARDAAGIVLTDDAYPTVVAAVERGRTVGAQLRRAVAFYLGAKLALVTCMLVPLALGRQAPFAPVHIVLLELFMDLGASVAFVAEPSAPAAMHRPPRRPGTRFLDAPEVSALLSVAVALTVAVLPAYLLMSGSHPLAVARAAAVLAWLAGHALVAWTLRAQPRLSPRRNLAFPVWAASAAAFGLLAALSPLGGLVRLAGLPAGGLGLVATTVAAAVGLAVAVSTVLRLRSRL